LLNSPWVGLKNFEFFINSQYASRITFNTIYLNFIFIIVGTVVALVLAIILVDLKSKRLAKFSQAVMFFPYFISWVIVGYFSYAILNMDYGLLNSVLKFLGMRPVQWYVEPAYWPFILTVASTWKVMGYTAVIFLAGISGINKEYYEAAHVDGAGKIRQIISITLPSLSPLIIILTLLSVGRIMYADFGMFYNMVKDSGPLYSTVDVFDTFIYRSLRVTGDIGMAAAANFFQAVVGFVLVMGSNLMVRRIDPEKALF
jgi:putative aldouronate transport system permease protein